MPLHHADTSPAGLRTRARRGGKGGGKSARTKAPLPLIIETVLNNGRVILARRLLITRFVVVHVLAAAPPPPVLPLSPSSSGTAQENGGAANLAGLLAQNCVSDIVPDV